jgi:hypothetical protein
MDGGRSSTKQHKKRATSPSPPRAKPAKAANKAVVKAANKAVVKAANKAVVKAVVKAVDKAVVKAVNKAVNKAVVKAAKVQNVIKVQNVKKGKPAKPAKPAKLAKPAKPAKALAKGPARAKAVPRRPMRGGGECALFADALYSSSFTTPTPPAHSLFSPNTASDSPLLSGPLSFGVPGFATSVAQGAVLTERNMDYTRYPEGAYGSTRFSLL